MWSNSSCSNSATTCWPPAMHCPLHDTHACHSSHTHTPACRAVVLVCVRFGGERLRGRRGKRVVGARVVVVRAHAAQGLQASTRHIRVRPTMSVNSPTHVSSVVCAVVRVR
jgi:hypothetical protein